MTQDDLMLVTGAGGYVGGVLVESLVKSGRKVRAMVRNPAKTDALKALGVDIVVADLTDEKSLAAAVQGVKGVYHIASIFRQAGLPDAAYFDANAEGTRRLLDASIAAGVQRFIHCSTGGVLGHVGNPPGNEETPYNPGDVYQRSKMEGEKIALSYLRSGRLRGVVIRPAMIYGPADTRNLKMFRLIARRRFFYLGRPQHVHFIDVRDLVQAFHLAMAREDISGEIYMIAGEKSVPLPVMAEEIAKNLGVPPPRLRFPVKPVQWLGSICEAICTPLHIPPPIYRRRVDFFTKNRHFDASKAARDLGFKPARRFEDEVADVTRWYKDHGWL